MNACPAKVEVQKNQETKFYNELSAYFCSALCFAIRNYVRLWCIKEDTPQGRQNFTMNHQPTSAPLSALQLATVHCTVSMHQERYTASTFWKEQTTTGQTSHDERPWIEFITWYAQYSHFTFDPVFGDQKTVSLISRLGIKRHAAVEYLCCWMCSKSRYALHVRYLEGLKLRRYGTAT